jgi:tRNA-specific 2-thiouridylase
VFEVSSEQKELNAKTTVVVGMSGGVDSSVTALILKEQGYRVIGMFMKNWEEKDPNGVCRSSYEYEDVVRVCEKIDIPYYAVEFVKEYWDHVFLNFLAEYKAGYTPNPDILCNREIKFNVFLKKALSMGADYLATGHYAQNQLILGQSCLVKGKDEGKDQSYFLYTIKKEILNKVLFPIGHMEKPLVREIAKKYDLATHSKKDSTGICFIGERNFRQFLSQYLQAQPGKIKTLDGKTVGEHQGVAYYTLGQRKGLGLGGEGEAWFVVSKDPKTNTVYVERGEKHPALYSDYITATELTWVAGNPPSAESFRCRAKTRYRQKDQACTVSFLEGEKVRVDFDLPQRSVTPRQSVVFYDGEICLGGGMIEAAGPNYYEQNRPLPEGVTV